MPKVINNEEQLYDYNVWCETLFCGVGHSCLLARQQRLIPERNTKFAQDDGEPKVMWVYTGIKTKIVNLKLFISC